MPYNFIVVSPSSLTFPAILALVGSIFWLLAYVLMIRKGFQDSTYGIPLLAIMLNFTWEIIYTMIHPPSVRGELWLRLAWLALDIPNVWLLVRYGRAIQKIPYIQIYYYLALGSTFVLCFVGHLCYYDELAFMGATQSAYVINYVMSVLFVFLYFNRPDMKGLSYGGAWAKMLGTTCLSLANIPLWPAQPRAPHFFLYYLFAACFLFDVFYILLLRQARHAAAVTA
jgi:hypothetical protein